MHVAPESHFHECLSQQVTVQKHGTRAWKYIRLNCSPWKDVRESNKHSNLWAQCNESFYWRFEYDLRFISKPRLALSGVMMFILASITTYQCRHCRCSDEASWSCFILHVCGLVNSRSLVCHIHMPQSALYIYILLGPGSMRGTHGKASYCFRSFVVITWVKETVSNAHMQV